MDSQKKQEIKKTIKSVKHYLYSNSLYEYEHGYRVYGGDPLDNNTIAARYLRRFSKYRVVQDGRSYYAYYITGPEYKSPPKIVSILTRSLIVVLGVVLSVIWVMLFGLNIILSILQWPLWWIVTGESIEDEDILLSKQMEWTGEFIEWLWFELRYHKLLELNK